MDEHNRNKTTAALILAAGHSSRMQDGQESHHKLLLPLGEGTVLSHVIEATLASQARPILLILGHQSAQVRTSLRDTALSDVILIENTEFAQGMSTSLRKGIQVLMERDSLPRAGAKRSAHDTIPTQTGSIGYQGRHEARPLRIDGDDLGRREARPLRIDGALILLGDQPLVTSALLNQLIELKYTTSKRIVAPFYNGKRGNPVLFDADLFPELLAVTGDEGGRSVVERYRTEVGRLDVGASLAWYDVDTWEAYQQVLRIWQEREK